ncbi:alpha/beta-hydrolase [Gonapodya prolifera JEL478]|uniref:Alpha/beta-hydrolase n=1 Tax=Gonapodya prolifera (strain JEL478) TaxID=1344416 RepID=A0A139A1X9_GONPJ|nr:alpha/beta-hydrolase [Gonapodya prolifera JEL478]|eukprot:KXS10751.1 alpha/beta-hydrolase [Gonapodya prolifera JEL478]
MPFAPVGESRNIPTQLYYEVFGDGPSELHNESPFKEANFPLTICLATLTIYSTEPVRSLFIMGLGGAWVNWDFQSQVLGKAGGQYSVCVFDNRGVGQTGVSESDPGSYTTDMMAQDALEILDTLRWDRAHVIGVSLVVLASPSRVLSLALIATTAGPRKSIDGQKVPLPIFEAQHDEIRFRFTTNLLFPQTWLRSPPSPTYPFTIAHADPSSSSDSATNRDVQRCWWQERLETYPGQSVDGWRRQWSAARGHYVSDEELRGIGDAGVQTVVIVGTSDSVIPPSNSSYLATTIPAQLISLEGGGHGITAQYPVELDSALEDLWHDVERERKERSRRTDTRPLLDIPPPYIPVATMQVGKREVLNQRTDYQSQYNQTDGEDVSACFGPSARHSQVPRHTLNAWNAEGRDGTSTVRQAVPQAYGYACFNRLRYFALSSHSAWWFFRRVPGVGRVESAHIEAVIASGLMGAVASGTYRGRPAVFKLFDKAKRPALIGEFENERDAYIKLKHLQEVLFRFIPGRSGDFSSLSSLSQQMPEQVLPQRSGICTKRDGHTAMFDRKILFFDGHGTVKVIDLGRAEPISEEGLAEAELDVYGGLKR